MARNTQIGSLKISLLAVTKGFNRGMGSAILSSRRFTRLMRTDLTTALGLAAGKLSRFGLRALGSIPRIIGKVLGSLARLVKMLGTTLVIAAGAATAALVLLTKASFKEIDRLAKSARVIGINVNALRAMELAAREAGIEANTLSKSLRIMARNATDAAKGTGEAIDAFKDLGLDAKKLAALSIPEQFNEISDALQEVQSASERIQLASDIFGGRGIDLLRLFSSAVRGASKDLRDLGVELSDIDAASIERANDAAGKLKLAFRGIGDVLAVKTAPLIEAFSNAAIAKLEETGGIAELVNDVMAKMGPITATAIDFIGVAAENTLSFMSDVLAEVSKFFEKIENDGPAAASKFAGAMLGITDSLLIAVTSLEVSLLNILAAISSIAAVAEGLFNKVRDLALVGFGQNPGFRFLVAGSDKRGGADARAAADAESAAALQSILDDADAANKKALELFERLERKQLEDPLARIGLGEEGIKKSAAAMKQLTFEASVTIEKAEQYIEKINAAGGVSEEFAKKVQAIKDKYLGLNAVLPETIELFDLVKKEQDEVADATNKLNGVTGDFSDSLVSALFRGENAFEALRDTALSALEDIASAFLKQGIATLLGGLFGGLGGGGGGGLFGGGGGGLFEGGGGDFFGRSSSAQFALASNTPTFKPTSADERGGGEVHINFFGPTSGDDAIREQVMRGIAEAQPTLTRTAIAGMIDYRSRRGGPRPDL